MHLLITYESWCGLVLTLARGAFFIGHGSNMFGKWLPAVRFSFPNMLLPCPLKNAFAGTLMTWNKGNATG